MTRSLGDRIDVLRSELRSEMRDLRFELGSRINALGKEVRDLCEMA